MQIAVTYENGVLIPQKPLKLRQTTLWVSIPDAMLSPEAKSETRVTMRERINRILGKHAHPRIANPESDKAIWQQHLLDKYQ